ncbi:restriction endonuclease subunit S [Bacteroides eggerthii]|uniref:restriction endonuclease subunit S n=1 Tax=Bacteroides eggerthii TaxID=28111 RepID=UPI00189C1037|nr:restriction endonuclease subunit S [Bacteroides eggerthii]
MSQFIEMFQDSPLVRLGDHIETQSGGTPNTKKGEYYDGGTIPWLSSGEVNLGYISSTEKYITEEGLENSAAKWVPKNSVVIAMYGATAGKVGFITIPLTTNQAVCALLPNDAFNPLYLYYAVSSKKDWMIAQCRGAAQPNISQGIIRSMKIPMPSLSEQIQFVNVIKQADKSKFGDFKSQFIEMFGNCKSQGTLSSLCATFIDGDWIESKDQSDNGIRLIQTGNVGFGFFKGREDKSRYITEETFKKLNCTEVVPGDILISRLPDPIGRACIVPEGIGKAITAVDCTIVRLNATLLPEFLISFSKTALYASQINKIKTGTTRLRVSRGNLGNVIIPIPPIESQHHFAAIAQQADKSKSVIQKALVYLNDIQSDELGKIA